VYNIIAQLSFNFTLNQSENSVFKNNTGKIIFNNTVELGGIAKCLEIENNSIKINSSDQQCGQYNISANVTFFNIEFANPKPIVDVDDDGNFEDCPLTLCTNSNHTGTNFSYTVVHFTTFSSGETNTPPNITSILLNATDAPLNTTNANLTLVLNGTDIDGDAFKNITVWFRNNVSILLLNMPFEGGSNSSFTRDYTPLGNNGTVINATFNATGGYDGFGAYEFDGDTDFILVNVTGDTIEMRIDNGTGFRHVVNASGTIYVNGIVSSASIPFNGTHIGIFPDGTFFNGTIDEVRIYNRTLSPEQILALFNNRTDLIVSQETQAGETWHAEATPNDSTEDGTSNSYFDITVQASPPNNPPSITQAILNATDAPSNTTNANLTLHLTGSDLDGDAFKNITVWFVDNASIQVLNMPFENNTALPNETTRDYTPFENNGTVINATFNATGGHDGFGAYQFDGIDDKITVSDSDSLDVTDAISILMWVKDPIFDGFEDGTLAPFTTSGNKNWFVTSPVANSGSNSAQAGNITDNQVTSLKLVAEVTAGNEQIQFARRVSSEEFDSLKFYIDGVLQQEWSGLIDWKTFNFSVSVGEHTFEWNYTKDGFGSDGADTAYIDDILISGPSNRTFLEKDFSYSLINDNMIVVGFINGNRTANVSVGIDKNWTHLAMTYDKSTIKLYKNGQLADSTPFDQTISVTTSDVIIGKNINGTIDEVQIWNRSLSAEQIRLIFENRTDIIVSDETQPGDWFAQVTPNDGIEDGVTVTSNNITIFNTDNPLFSKFNGSTTNFKTVLNPGSVPNAILEIVLFGRILWNNPINVSNQDFDAHVFIGQRFVSIDSANLDPSINTSADITLLNVICPVSVISFAEGVHTTINTIHANGTDCVVAGICTNVVCSGTTLNFSVSRFTGFAAGANANLTIDNDGPKRIGSSITFNATYINATSGDFIIGATCNITFADLSAIMTGTATTYEFSRSFSNAGTFNYNVTCNRTTFTTLTANDTVTVLGLSVTKTDNPDPVVAGTLLNYTIIVNNTEDFNVTNVTVFDFLDPNVAFVSSQPPGGSPFDIGNLTVNESITINITVLVSPSTPPGTILVNTVNVTFKNETSNLSASTSELTTVVTSLSCPSESIAVQTGYGTIIMNVVKTDFPDPARIGGFLDYTINVSNTGDVAAINVVVNDTLDPNVIFKSSQPPGGSPFNLELLAPGESVLINIRVEIDSSLQNITILNNSVTVTFENQTGYGLSVTTCEPTVAVPFPECSAITGFEINKTASDSTPLPGDEVTFFITVQNIESNTISDINVTEELPAGLSFVSANPSPTSTNPETWNFAQLEPGEVIGQQQPCRHTNHK